LNSQKKAKQFPANEVRIAQRQPHSEQKTYPWRLERAGISLLHPCNLDSASSPVKNFSFMRFGVAVEWRALT
jgi:hypothetical protein